MKKINAKFDNKDRIICVTIFGGHQFFYQPYGTKERYWLFNTKEFSASIFSYFRKYGRNLGDLEFSLTLKEFYEFKRYHNQKLSKLVERIPSQVEYVIREYIINPKEVYKQCDKVCEPEHIDTVCNDYGYVA